MKKCVNVAQSQLACDKEMAAQIIFKDGTQILPGENCSKLIHPDCELFRIRNVWRQRAIDRYGDLVSPERMPPHIEVITYLKDVPFGGLDATEMLRRTQWIEDQPIEVDLIGVLGKALVFLGPEAPGYGPTHVTIAHFQQGVPEDWAEFVKSHTGTPVRESTPTW